MVMTHVPCPELEFKLLSLGGATKLSYSCILEGDFRVMEMMFKVCLCVCVCKRDRDREIGVGWTAGRERQEVDVLCQLSQ